MMKFEVEDKPEQSFGEQTKGENQISRGQMHH